MTKIHDIVLFLLLAAGLLVACSHRNDPTDPLTTEKNEILVRSNVVGFMRGNRIQSIDTNTDLQEKDLKIDAYYHDSNTKYLDGKKLHYTGGDPAWVFWSGTAQEHYYWPILGSEYIPAEGDPISVSSLDFVGFCPYEKPAYIGAPTYAHATGVSFTCDMSSHMTPASQIDMPEYLIAVSNGQTLADQDAHNGVPMEFKHPLALVKFVIADASGTAVTVNSISIADLHTGGTCTYDGTDITWDSYSGTPADMELTGLSLHVGETTETLPFIVIPFSGTKTLTVNASWDDWSEVDNKDINTEVTFDWQPGYIYTYTLTVTKYALKVDITRYTEQW